MRSASGCSFSAVFSSTPVISRHPVSIMQAPRPTSAGFAYAPLTSKAFSPRPQHRLLDALHPARRHRQHFHRHQYSRHHLLPALQGHDARENAPFRLDVGRGRFPGDHRHAAAFRRADHDLAGPLSGSKILRYPGGRLRRVVAALLLDLRPSGGLHPHGAGLCHRLGGHTGLLAKADFRLSRSWWRRRS